MTPAQFNKERKALVSAVLAQVKPFFYESGYVKYAATDRREALRVWVPRGADGKPTMKSYTLKGGFVVITFEGFTEEGVITDAFGHGLVTTYWDGIPIEDLYRLNQWMQRMMPKLTAYDQAQKAAAKSAAKSAARAQQLVGTSHYPAAA